MNDAMITGTLINILLTIVAFNCIEKVSVLAGRIYYEITCVVRYDKAGEADERSEQKTSLLISPWQ